MAKLLIQSGTLAGKSKDFSDKLNIGRNQTNDMVLLDKRISGNHALIYFDNGHFMLMDLDSTNGTKLNGIKLAPKSPMTLKTGDRIEIESYMFSFEEGGAVSPGKMPAEKSPAGEKHLDFTFDNIEDIKEMAKWIKFVGTYNFILGILMCLSIFGLIIGWLFIVLGMKLRESGSKMLVYTNGGPGSQYINGIEKLRDYFKWIGVICIVSLVGTGLALVTILVMLLIGAAAI